LTFTAVSLRSTLFGQEQSVEVASRHQGGRSESCRNRLEITRLRKHRCYNSRLLELPMREATQVASSAALSGSHHKAPGFAEGYLLRGSAMSVVRRRPSKFAGSRARPAPPPGRLRGRFACEAVGPKSLGALPGRCGAPLLSRETRGVQKRSDTS
jgi:hypothetical protein